MGAMSSILANFNWAGLFSRYTDLCGAYGTKSKTSVAQDCLRGFCPTPATDVDLYRQLISRFESEWKNGDGISFECYSAMLFWKMYSTQPNFCKSLFEGRHRKQVESELKSLSKDAAFRRAISKDADAVIALVRRLSDYSIYGMMDKCRFAVRTTFLHFRFPDIVPIADVMTLAATGRTEDGAGTNEKNLKPYFETVWQLEVQNLPVTAQSFGGFPESAVRLNEMALFVIGHAIRNGIRSQEKRRAKLL